MHLKIQHTLLLLASFALFSGGCASRYVPDMDGQEIHFSAGTVQLQEETKGVNSLDHRTAFVQDEAISVYAWHQQENGKIFDNQTVTLTDAANDIWTYSPKKKWRWKDNDYYDFLAVPGTVSGETSLLPTSSSPFSLSVHYDARVSQYDLLMAGTRRRITDQDPSAVVQLDFQHMLSAVKVVFYRHTGSQKFVITSYGFSDLIVAADIIGRWDDSAKKFSSRLDNTEHNHQKKFGEDRNAAEPWRESAKFVDTYDPGIYDLLIPQNLDSADPPSLEITLRDDTTDNNEYVLDPIPLKDITIKNTDTPITRWEPGKVYIYEVHILLNGGVLVNVITTEWEDIYAQTPGLMI